MPILRRLKNFIIIHGMNFLSLFSRIKKETVVSHLAENQKTWGKYASGLKYIEKQSELSNLFYGQECSRYSLKIANGTPLTAAFNACEIIAIQNALIALGIEHSLQNFPDKISHFEKKGNVLKGYFGTAPRAVKKYLKERQVTIQTLVASKENIGSTPVQILFFQNGRKITSGIHTICITNTNGITTYLNGKPNEESVPLLLLSLAK